MKRFLWVMSCGIICTQLAGCAGWLVRTTSSTEARVDQEISGNRGYLLGKAATAPKEPLFKERKVYKIEIELPDLPKKTKAATEDKLIWGNKGYLELSQGKQATQIMPAAEKEVKSKLDTSLKTTPKEAVIKEGIPTLGTELAPAEPKQALKRTTYEVKNGDTLQKISTKFYGTSKNWPLLYEANKDKLRSADDISPGQVLVIPEVKEYKK